MAEIPVEILINIIPAMAFTFFIQISIHEIGHFLGGSLTGWHFISLHLFYLVIMKKERGYKIKKVSTLGFQCIMYPNSLEQGAALYTLGGCLMNLVAVLIGLIGMIIQHDNPVLWMYAWSFFVFGIMLFFINIIPSTKRICNDGACFRLINSDKEILRCHNAQLMTARYLNLGFTYNQIRQDIICNTPEHADNDISAYQAVLEYYYWMELDKYDLMRRALIKININGPISPIILNIISMERLYAKLFQLIINEKAKPINIENSVCNIAEYIKTHETKGDVQSLRVKGVYTVYENLHAGNREHALSIIDETIQHLDSMESLYLGEKIFCINQLKKIRALCV